MIWTVVKFCLHYSHKSLENADEIIFNVSAAAHDSKSTKYIRRKARDTAAIQTREHAMKEMGKIEKHVAKMQCYQQKWLLIRMPKKSICCGIIQMNRGMS